MDVSLLLFQIISCTHNYGFNIPLNSLWFVGSLESKARVARVEVLGGVVGQLLPDTGVVLVVLVVLVAACVLANRVADLVHWVVDLVNWVVDGVMSLRIGRISGEHMAWLDRGHIATVGKALVVGNVAVTMSIAKSMSVPVELRVDWGGVDRGRCLQMLRESCGCEKSWKKKEQAEHCGAFSSLLVSGPSEVS